MKKLLLLLGFVWLGSCSQQEASESASQADNISPFHQLAGHWVKDGEFARVAESWFAQADGSMQGSVYRIEQSDSSLLEQLRIRKQDSTYIYTALVSGQNNNQPVDFELFDRAGDSSFVFVNPSHDFPQRIVYRIGTDNLHITLGLFHTDMDDRHFLFIRLK